MFKLNNEYNIFRIDFVTVKDSIKGLIAMASDDEMLLHIAGFTSTLCDVDDFFYLIIEADSPSDLAVGKTITIDGVEVTLTSIESETFEESMIFWENEEMEEYNKS